MKEFATAILGNQSLASFTALMFFALLAAGLSLLLQTTKRDVNSNSTPERFSWRFFFWDNYKRVITSLLLIYVALRFAPELFGIQINPFWALIIGFTNDKIAQILKDKTNIMGQKKSHE